MTFCMIVASRPPHSRGQLMAAHLPSLSLALPRLAPLHRPLRVIALLRPDLPLLEERRQVGVEPRAQLLAELPVLGGVGEIHGPNIPGYRPAGGLHVQRRAGPAAGRRPVLPRQRGAWRLCAGDDRRRARLHRRVGGRRSSTSAGPGLLVPEEHGGLGLWARRRGRAPGGDGQAAASPDPFFSSSVCATLLAQRLGADRSPWVRWRLGSCGQRSRVEEGGGGDPLESIGTVACGRRIAHRSEAGRARRPHR